MSCLLFYRCVWACLSLRPSSSAWTLYVTGDVVHEYDHQYELWWTGQGCVGSRRAAWATAGEEGRRGRGNGRGERGRGGVVGGQGCVGSRGASRTTAGEEGRKGNGRGRGEREGRGVGEGEGGGQGCLGSRGATRVTAGEEGRRGRGVEGELIQSGNFFRWFQMGIVWKR